MTAISALILAIAIVVGFSAHYITHKSNAAAEQMAEAVIKLESGIDVDFSPHEDANKKPD